MTNKISIALAQINPTVGDISSNIELIRIVRKPFVEMGVDLVVFGELSVSGYPPEDLVLKHAFQAVVKNQVEALALETIDGGPALLIGAPWLVGGELRNAALLLDEGKIVAIRFKHELPNYGVFDEKRIFTAGPLPGPISFRGVRLGVLVCEDMWFDDVAECLQESGAEMLVVLNGSPFETDKIDERLNYAVARVTETNLPLIYVNLVGGQDELVFDGASFVLGADRSLRARMPSWKSQITLTNWSRTNDGWVCDEGEVTPSETILHGSYQAMVLGLRDYVQKNRFKGIVLGMSGGVDSAISAAVAVDAIGPSRVHCIMMPSPYTSQVSLDDAAECSNLLGVQLDEIKIKPAMDAFEQMLSPLFEGHEQDVTEENIQSRTRGNLLMAISNKMGHMVLTTGNKSEMSVGYATLYGDMCGGYSVLKDVYKLDVFKLCNWRNANYPSGVMGPKGYVIPERIITKPPSAELKLDQTDQDSLPPYEILDSILQSLIEDELGVDEITAQGFDPEMVRRIWRMLDLAEYKRRQAPPGVKLTRRAFGRDRRYPITNGFRGHI
jgi:NAD+ synthase